MEKTQKLILALDTALDGGSVSLLSGETLLGEQTGEVSRAEKVLVSIDMLFKDSGFALTELDIIAISLGPGSFTGIRIGIATALGFKRSLGIPLAGVSAFEAIASLSGERSLTAAVPLGRDRVGIQTFETAETARFSQSKARTMSIGEFADLVCAAPSGQFVIAGQDKSVDRIFDREIPSNVRFDERSTATLLGLFAATSPNERPLEPIYLGR